ncbi:universal stress protein [Neolewinella agarilytica]|uniref:Nucleotide-binding universal stress protein, UspA family n=1 Tax=Neolewinella agarilytica TaxID=478744 RepID=A0A1H9KX14_9BACT|nr:universal stress protein [Neolewinella agarilytica]SER03549.1 Nucleotide-binding universal stress protein, UspA family [Neolewinella agarilytica]
MQKIIVPTDFSSAASAALRYAHFLAEAIGCDLEVIHVHDGYGHVEDSRVKKGGIEARQAAQRSIDQFIRFSVPAKAAVAAEGPETEVTISSLETVGSPTDVLIKASQEEATCLIVMGGVGTGAVSTVTPFFGSVARTVAEQSACPVLLVPEDYKNPKMERASIAFDVVKGLRETSKGFDFLRIPLAPSMRLVHVRDSSEKGETRKEIDLMEEVLNTDFPGYPVELDLLNPGTTAFRLLDYAEEENIDLLVLGHRKRSLWKRLFLDSDIKHVMRFAVTPLLVIPISEY